MTLSSGIPAAIACERTASETQTSRLSRGSQSLRNLSGVWMLRTWPTTGIPPAILAANTKKIESSSTLRWITSGHLSLRKLVSLPRAEG